MPPTWDTPDTALALDSPAIIPFIPLMKGGNTEVALRKCANRLRQESEAEELIAVLALFAALVMDKAVVMQIVGWHMEVLKESPLYQELTSLAREEGFEEGRKEGQREGERIARAEERKKGRDSTLTALRRFSAFRYKVAENHFDDKFQRLDWETLTYLCNVVADVNTIEEFEAILDPFLQSTEV